MSSNNSSRKIVSVAEQAFERAEDGSVDEDGFEVVDERPAFRATVEQQTQATVDANHPDARPEGMTLEAEERMQAREAEIARTRERAEAGPDTVRERGSRRLAAERSRARRQEFQRRAASVDRWRGPDRADPRDTLSRDELAAVNEQAAKISDEVRRGASRAALSRQLAERVARGEDLLEATLAVHERERAEPGRVVDIDAIGEVDSERVTVEGTIETLWDADSAAIQDVGLIADGTGRTKVTIWTRSRQTTVQEGERVRLVNVSKSWYEGRVSVAVTGWSRVEFPNRTA